MFCDTNRTFFWSNAGQGVETLNYGQSYTLSTFRLTCLNRQIIVWFSWIISICEIYGEYRTEGHNSVLKTVTGSRAEKSSKGHKTIGFVF